MSHFNNNEQGIRRGGAVHPNMAGGMTYGESPASGPAPTTAGHHKHDILNKLDPRVDSTQDRRPMPPPQQGHVPAGTYGPHSSRIANILDPRVDSDMDHRGVGAGAGAGAGAGVGAGGAGVGATQGYQQPAMHGAAVNTSGAGGAAEGTYGPHRSRIANALDPRVDSDMDGSRNPHHHVQYATTDTNHGGGAGFPTGAAAAGAAAPGYGPGPGMTSVGQHQGYNDGYQQQPAQQPTMHGAAAAGGPGGHRHGGVGNVDPTMAGPGGPAPSTAGPHRSDLLNKLDPRVDSKTGMKAERRGI